MGNRVEQKLNKFSSTGLIDFPTFLTMMAHRNRDCDTVEEMREAFRVFDRDNLGYIPVKEIRFVISNLNVKLTQAELEELVGAVDIDGNGQVTFEEFKKMITPK